MPGYTQSQGSALRLSTSWHLFQGSCSCALNLAACPTPQVRGPEDLDEDDDDEEVERIQLGDKTVCIRTSTLEEKATACNMLCCYMDELKQGFLPYVKQVADIMVPLLKFYFHEEVRGVRCLHGCFGGAAMQPGWRVGHRIALAQFCAQYFCRYPYSLPAVDK